MPIVPREIRAVFINDTDQTPLITNDIVRVIDTGMGQPHHLMGLYFRVDHTRRDGYIILSGEFRNLVWTRDQLTLVMRPRHVLENWNNEERPSTEINQELSEVKQR